MAEAPSPPPPPPPLPWIGKSSKVGSLAFSSGPPGCSASLGPQQVLREVSQMTDVPCRALHEVGTQETFGQMRTSSVHRTGREGWALQPGASGCLTICPLVWLLHWTHPLPALVPAENQASLCFQLWPGLLATGHRGAESRSIQGVFCTCLIRAGL